MPTSSCSCGFTELSDESLTDHLQYVFEPDDNRGFDGLDHTETSPLTCSCGFTAVIPVALDKHFLAVFMPPSRIGRDDRRHEIRGSGA
jgi:hypothetical protein